MYGILDHQMVEIVFLLMARKGIISLKDCDAMTDRFRQFPSGTTLDAVVEELRGEVETQPWPEVSQEPLCHSHLTDGLPDDHPLAWQQVHCERCSELVHAANNECMQTWFEFEGHVACAPCFGDYLCLFGDALGEKGFGEFLQSKG
jgi:hypothetical protein